MRRILVSICLILAANATSGLNGAPVLQANSHVPQPEITDPVQHGTTVYLVHVFPSFIERFDLASEEWLEEVDLNDIPTAFHVDEDGMYIGYGRRVVQVETDSAERHLTNTSTEVSQIISDDNWLFILHGTDLLITNKLTGSRVNEAPLWYSAGLSMSPNRNRIFARTSGQSPSDIQYYDYDPVTGEIGMDQDSPYHGDYPGASQTYVEPAGVRVFDNSGTGYFTEDLTYAGSLGNPFNDILFYEGNYILRRGQSLAAYSPYLRETGVYELANESMGIAEHGGTIFSFSENGTEWLIEKVDVSALNPSEPGEPLDPRGLDYPITDIQQGSDGTLYLLSSELLSVFRWSPITQGYLETIPLVNNASFMAFAPQEDALILAYPDKKVTKLKLASLEEEHLFNSPQEPCGLSMAGDYIFLCDPSGAWVSHFTYTLDGQPVDQREWNYYSHEYVWSEPNRRMYYFRDDTSPNDIIMEEIDENGMLGPDTDSPYHSSTGMKHPIRVAPDGSYLVLGSGRIFDADNLNQVNSLSNDIVDAVWLDDQMITLWDRPEHNVIQFWDNRLAVERTGEFIGNPLRLFEHDGSLITVSTIDEIPWLAVWNADMSQSDLAASLTSNVNSAPEGASVTYDLVVSNRGVNEATDADVSLSLPEVVHSPLWICEGTGGASCDNEPRVGELNGQFDIPAAGELHFSLNALLHDDLIDAPPEASASVNDERDPQMDNNVAVVLDDSLLSRSKTGTWWNSGRDGEGFLVEVTSQGDRLIAMIAWYTYVDGEQAWLFGNVDFPQGSSTLEIPMVHTEGAEFGSAFDPGDVVVSDAGTVTLEFTKDEELDVSYETVFGSGEIKAQRLDPPLSQTNDSSSEYLTQHHSGAWHDYSKPGEGLLLALTSNGSTNTLVVSWYSYLEGRQAWLIGSASYFGASRQLTVPLITATGASFGEAFSPDDVVRDAWGNGTLTLVNCMEAIFSYDGKYGNGALRITKSVLSIAPNLCQPD